MILGGLEVGRDEIIDDDKAATVPEIGHFG
jgi:hypothetical protein